MKKFISWSEIVEDGPPVQHCEEVVAVTIDGVEYRTDDPSLPPLEFGSYRVIPGDVLG